MKLEGKLAESGDYYCEASASNAIAMSEPVSIEFYGNEIKIHTYIYPYICILKKRYQSKSLLYTHSNSFKHKF